MADQIRCPMCSRLNPADLDVCQYCQARLKPLIAGSTPPVPPPTPPSQPETPSQNADQPSEEAPDWLHSLRGKEETGASEWDNTAESSSGEEDIPDWLSRIREKSDSGPEETAPEPPASSPPAGNELPDWLTGATFEEPAQQSQPSAPSGDLPDWLRDIREPDERSAPGPAGPASGPEEQPGDLASGGEPGWLEQLRSQQMVSDSPSAPPPSAAFSPGGAGENQIPDWLQSSPPPQPPQPPTPAEGSTGSEQPSEDLPEWLSNLMGEPPSTSSEPSILPWAAAGEEPPAQTPDFTMTGAGQPMDWGGAAVFSIPEPGEGAGSGPAQMGQENISPSLETPGETPDWLSSFGEPSPGADQVEPDWLASLENPPAQSQASVPGEPGPAVEEPQYYASLQQTPPAESPEPTPDWLEALGSDQPAPPPASEPTPALLFEESLPTPPPGEPVEPFVMADLPDWLSALGPAESGQAKESGQPPAQPSTPKGTEPAEPAEEAIVPAELPSWVQAMRPIESVAASSAAPPPSQETDQRIERAGPLAGLKGILPAEPLVAEYRKPPTYSVKLQTSESQKRYAQLLDEMLANETEPLAHRAERLISSQRVLRLVVGILVVAAVLLGSFYPFMPIPSQPAVEMSNLYNAVEALPGSAPVLMVFDYEPALAGEMESAAAPVLDHLMEKGARLSLVTTSPTGQALADRLLGSVFTPEAPDYQQPYLDRQAVIDLGYLAGGPAGIYSFVINPGLGAPRWAADNSNLQDVHSLADYRQIFLLTDSLDTGRAWLEQLAAAGPSVPGLDEVPVMLVTSAQAAPLLRPYLDSRQADGLLNGLMGGAQYEQLLQRPGVANRRWDSFAGGLLAAIVLVVVGGLVNGTLSLFSRRKTKDEA